MADIPLSTINGGGSKPPTSLDFVVVSASAGAQVANVTDKFGAKVTATVTSSSLTEVLNITGSGAISFASLLNITTIGNTVTNPKIRIAIDGVTALDASSGTTLTSVQAISIIGRYDVTSGMTEVNQPFNKSLVVSIAGDGTDGVAFAYKRTLT